MGVALIRISEGIAEEVVPALLVVDFEAFVLQRASHQCVPAAFPFSAVELKLQALGQNSSYTRAIHPFPQYGGFRP